MLVAEDLCQVIQTSSPLRPLSSELSVAIRNFEKTASFLAGASDSMELVNSAVNKALDAILQTITSSHHATSSPVDRLEHTSKLLDAYDQIQKLRVI